MVNFMGQEILPPTAWINQIHTPYNSSIIPLTAVCVALDARRSVLTCGVHPIISHGRTCHLLREEISHVSPSKSCQMPS
jgi:hypothetical protein